MLDMLQMSVGKGDRKLRAKRAEFQTGETPTKTLHLTLLPNKYNRLSQSVPA